MTSITAVAAQIIAQPAPVTILDTCNFLDLFRRDTTRQQPRVPAEEIRIASELLQLVTARPDAVHLVVPELVPGEFADHASRIEREFAGWLGFHDENQDWLAEAAPWIGTALPTPLAVHPLGLHAGFRRLANELLAQAIVLDRDQTSLNRAVARLIAKRRPSHKKEIKDSMNMEQSLELCSQLRNSGFTHPAVFISSNTNDYAAASTSSQLHNDLQAEFVAVSLEYFPSLRAAIGSLRARGVLP
ncbi:MAG: hypothetical protein ABSH35_14030 [Isosphaeraceae bacterium]|jgi:hypothetical protein